MIRVEKTPAEKGWYGFDFARDGWLADLGDGVTILTGDDGPVWTITPLSSAEDETPLESGFEDLDEAGEVATIYLTGGTAGRKYLVTCHAKPSDDPTSDVERSFIMHVRSAR